MNDWLRAVKEKVGEIDARHKELLTRRNAIQTQINSLSFVAEHDLLKGLVFPIGYNVSVITLEYNGQMEIFTCTVCSNYL